MCAWQSVENSGNHNMNIKYTQLFYLFKLFFYVRHSVLIYVYAYLYMLIFTYALKSACLCLFALLHI